MYIFILSVKEIKCEQQQQKKQLNDNDFCEIEVEEGKFMIIFVVVKPQQRPSTITKILIL